LIKSSIRVAIVQGPTDVVVLPIQRDIQLGLKAFRVPLRKQDFWSTQEFVEHHYSNLVGLFQEIIERCIQIEMKDLPEQPPVPSEAEKRLLMFPTIVTEKVNFNKMKIIQ
jgi:hypothetical protein